MSLFRRKVQPADEWPFDDPPSVAVITTRQVITDGQPILYVSHDEDGEWQFHTGGPMAEADARIVSLRSLVSRDSTLKSLADLPLGWIGFRDSASARWQRAEAEQPAI